jgi:hypothetical protein
MIFGKGPDGKGLWKVFWQRARRRRAIEGCPVKETGMFSGKGPGGMNSKGQGSWAVCE